ncbi:MAG: helix-turn-helix transcriptional regulator, partial [Lachnospiraceae bacterium]|nr:helix-turn-helix transcriptional regulator [Lachnospiraceae bacterium]
MTLGEQIKQAREEKNLSQEALAEYMGVSRQAVSKWENDTAIPQGTNKEMLAQVLDLEIIKEDAEVPRRRTILWSGWIAAVILLAVLVGVVIAFRIYRQEQSGRGVLINMETEYVEKPVIDQDSDSEADGFSSELPQLLSVCFYDSSQNEVTDMALWYNA